MNRPIAPPLLPLSGKNAFDNDLLRALTPFHLELVNQLNTQVQGVGKVVPAGESIYLTSAVHHVAGTSEIRRIEAPGGFTGPVWLIPDDGWSFVAGGNISRPLTATISKVVTIVYDGSRWHHDG